MRDFTLNKYTELLLGLKKGGYRFLTFEQYCLEKASLDDVQYVILRHDVDLKAENSLAIARIEHSFDIKASCYFRVVKQSNKPEIIKAIAGLGHEIGYHYEDMALCGGNPEKAIEHFRKQLDYFRRFYPIKTICMHGAPRSKYDGRNLWKQYDYHDYGIVGFYAMTSGRLEHFIFSCRTMGQKIEQWVYAKLGFPMLEVIGEVRTQLNSYECPGWINNKNDNKDDSKSIVNYEKRDNNCSVLLKGPCDLSHSQMYIKNKGFFDAEFTYVSNSNGQIIDAFNHSVHIEGLHSYTEEEKKQIVEDCIFVDPNMLNGSFFTKKYDVIFLSTLIESNYYIYRKKGTNVRVVFGGYDLTDCDNWDNYCNGTYYNGGNSFSIDYLKGFSEKYECVGRTTPKMYVEFLNKCLEWLPKETTLCLILGATKTFGVEFGYEDKQRIDRQKRLNEAIVKMSLMQPRIKCVEIDKCLCDKSDLTDDICHFSTRTYYEIAQEMVRIIALATGKQMQTYSTKIIQIDGLILKIRTVIKKVVSPQGWLYGKMKYIYTRIYKNRK